MAVGTFEYFSECLKRNTLFRVILPNEGDAGEGVPPMKTMVLLHGYCGCSGDWLWNSPVVDMAQKYHMCILLPTGENSFYLDGKATGRKYASFVGRELVEYARRTFGLSHKREDTFVGGFSMGGIRRDSHGAAVSGDLFRSYGPVFCIDLEKCGRDEAGG